MRHRRHFKSRDDELDFILHVGIYDPNRGGKKQSSSHITATTAIINNNNNNNYLVRLRKLNNKLDKRKRKICGSNEIFADEGEEDIHPPFIKCPEQKCFFTYHNLCPQTLERHLKEEHYPPPVTNH